MSPGAVVVTSSTPIWYITRATGLVAIGAADRHHGARAAVQRPVRGRDLAPVHHRCAAPQRRSGRAGLHRAAHRHRGRGQLHPDQPGRRGVPVHLRLPALLARARDDRVRPDGRRDRHQPGPEPARLPILAPGPLERLPVLAGGGGSRPRDRHRHAGELGALADRRVRGPDHRPDHLAAGPGLAASPGVRVASAVALAVVLLASGVWLANGPLQPGWSKRAGTPSSLLSKAAQTSAPAGGGKGAH